MFCKFKSWLHFVRLRPCIRYKAWDRPVSEIKAWLKRNNSVNLKAHITLNSFWWCVLPQSGHLYRPCFILFIEREQRNSDGQLLQLLHHVRQSGQHIRCSG